MPDQSGQGVRVVDPHEAAHEAHGEVGPVGGPSHRPRQLLREGESGGGDEREGEGERERGRERKGGGGLSGSIGTETLL